VQSLLDNLYFHEQGRDHLQHFSEANSQLPFDQFFHETN
jgi:hypothetical protein